MCFDKPKTGSRSNQASNEEATEARPDPSYRGQRGPLAGDVLTLAETAG
jgi:hypothetical protein